MISSWLLAPNLLLLVWAFFFGSLIGLSGIGLGSIGTAGLVVLFQINPVIAVGTNTVNGFLIKLIGSYRHYRYSHVEVALAKPLLIGAIPGEIVGVLLSHFAAPSAFKRILGASLLIVAAALLVDVYFSRGVETVSAGGRLARLRPGLAAAMGALVGLMVGVTSSGSGTLFTAIFLLVYRCLPRRAVGTAVFSANLLLFSAAVLHSLLGHVDFRMLLLLLAGSTPGIAFGTFLCRRAPQRALKFTVAVLILAAGVKLLF